MIVPFFRPKSRVHRSSELRTVRPALSFERLEDRVVPTVHVWGGGGGNNLWSNPANWVTGGAPQDNETGATLQFPNGNKTVNGASWSGGVATISTSTAHNFIVGQSVIVSGITPSGYNNGGTAVVITAAGTNSFSYALTTNPGAYSSGGLAGNVAMSNDVVNLGVDSISILSGANTSYSLAGNSVILTGNAEVNVFNSISSLAITAPLTAPAGVVNKTGSGVLYLGNSSVTPNSFSTLNITSVSAIGGGTGGGQVSILANEQVPNDAAVILNASLAGFNANSRTETVGSITMLNANPTDNGGLGTGPAGGGTLIVTGTLTVSSGKVTINSGGGSITANSVVLNGTTGGWTFGSSGTNRLITGSGGLTMSGGATLNTSGNTAVEVVLNGPLITLASATSNSISGSGKLVLNGARTFSVANGAAANDLSISATIVNGASIGSIETTGSGTISLNAANTFTGGTTIRNGVVLLSGANNMPTTGVVAVKAGGSFSVADGTRRANSAPSLNLESGSNLMFDWVAGNVDTLTSTAAATTAGSVGISINPLSVPTGTGLTLLTAPSGLQTANDTKYFIANNTNYTALLSQSDTSVAIGSFAAGTALTSAYWLGGQVVGAENAMAFSSGTTSNWAVAPTDTTPTANGVVPGSSANVFFSTNSGAVQQGNIVLGNSMTLNSLTFNDTTPVTIVSDGAFLSLNSSGSGAASAISVNQSAAISANLILPVSQTWTIAPTMSLAVGGIVSGANGLTFAGDGSTTLSGTNTYTGSTTISAGSLIAGTSGPLSAAGAFGNSASAITLGNAATTTNGSSPALLIGGAFTVARPVTIANQATSGTYTLGGSTTASAVFSGPITLNQPVTLSQVASGTTTISGVITDAAASIAVTKSGSGTIVLSAPAGNTYDGGTTISAGVLLVNNATGSGTGTGSVLVQASGTLGGEGFIDGAVSIDGTLAPGTTLGTLTVNNTVALGGVSSFDVTGGGTLADKLLVIGDLTYAGNLKITGSGFLNGDAWNLFDFAGHSGSFANNSVFGTAGDGVNLPSLAGGLTWQFDYATGVLSIALNIPIPTVSGIAPVVGPTTGGTIVTITGTNFVSVTSVTLAGAPLATFTVSGTTQITVTTPVHSAGAVDIVVTNLAGSGSLSGSSDFTYAAPAIASIEVNGGPGVVLGGSTWSLAGQHSVVKQIVVTFNQAVTVASDAFTVSPVPVSVNPGPGVVVVNGGATPSTAAVTASIAAALSPSTYLVTFSGPGTHGGGIIDSGVYDLTAIASKVAANGETMASDQARTFFAMFGNIEANNLYAGSTFTTPIPAGYASGDGATTAFVDPGSLFRFSDAFGSNAASPAGPPAYDIIFDSNLDGAIDPGDLFAFSDSFGIDWDF